jgi:hypothetical protein
MESETFRHWVAKVEPALLGPDGRPKLHRKLWEKVYVVQALYERGMLAPGKRGLGFAVGQEQLPSLFAHYGCTIVATDLDLAEAERVGWVASTQHAAGLQILNKHGLCDPKQFAERVTFRSVNMNDIPEDLRDFDFCWSACSFEHLGSIAKGIDFIDNMLHCLRPGGVAVHTTEFNVLSDTKTLDQGDTVLFRRRDIEEMVRRVWAAGHHIEPVNYHLGESVADHYVDTPPYLESPHVKLVFAWYLTTSIGLIIHKRGAGEEQGLPGCPARVA